MSSIVPRAIVAGLLLFSAFGPDAAESRSLSSGLTVSFGRVGYSTNGAIICLGFCGYWGRVTVWKDGQVLDGKIYSRVSRSEAAHFRSILRPFRPTGRFAYIDPSTTLPNSCPVKVKWPADHRGRQPVTCGSYFEEPLFEAVKEALKAVHLDFPAL